jgi:cation transport ATPase
MQAPKQATDPVCGMSVDTEAGNPFFEFEGATAMVVVVDGAAAGLVAAANPIKESTCEALQDLAADGVRL